MVEIRRARLDDAAGIARVHAESWRATYRGIVPDSFLDAIDVSEWAERRRRNLEDPTREPVSLVADRNGTIVGWSASGPNRETDSPYASELYTIYVLPGHERRGIGRMLLAASAGALVEQGMSSMMLWVLEDNWPARHFYEAMGGEYVKETQMEIGGAALTEVSYGWSELSALANPA